MLEPIKFFCNSALPAVYDDSLSYYEALTKIAAKLNDTINALNTLTASVTGDANTQELKANVNSIGYADIGEVSEFTQTDVPITNVKQGITEINKSLKTLAEGSFTNTNNLAAHVDIHSIAIENINESLDKVATSITGNGASFDYRDNVANISYNESTNKFEKGLAPTTNIALATNTLTTSINTMVTGFNNNTELNEIAHGSIETRLHTAEDDILQIKQVDAQQMTDISSLKTSVSDNENTIGWNKIGENGSIVIIMPVQYDTITEDYIREYANANGFNLKSKNKVYLFYPNTPVLKQQSLSQQAYNLTSSMTANQKNAVTMVYLVGDGKQAQDATAAIGAVLTSFPNAHFVYAPDCWFTVPSNEQDYNYTNYQYYNISVVRNGWLYLIGADVKTSTVTEIAYDVAPQILLDLLFTGDSNRYTEVRYYGGEGTTSSYEFPAYKLKRYGKNCIIKYYKDDAGTAIHAPFGASTYADCFKITNFLGFANVPITTFSSTASPTFGAITCKRQNNIEIATVIGSIPNDTEAPTALTKITSNNMM